MAFWLMVDLQAVYTVHISMYSIYAAAQNPIWLRSTFNYETGRNDISMPNDAINSKLINTKIN